MMDYRVTSLAANRDIATLQVFAGAGHGGDLAYYYGTKGSLSGMNLAAAQTTLQKPQFGTAQIK